VKGEEEGGFEVEAGGHAATAALMKASFFIPADAPTAKENFARAMSEQNKHVGLVTSGWVL